MPAVGLPRGTQIGKYVVQERLGIGGQAIVYKCRDPLLDRPVAIKQISSQLAEDPKFLERFRREAQIVARLGAEQPAVVTIHELVEDERGLFIVMEYVPGHSLETILRENPEPVEPKAALQIIWRLAAGLHAVHAAGIIHRDIKPSNIIIGEGLRAKIMDFGVAASTAGQASMPLGTTKYMAPELFEGGAVDARVDMYSLGFIAYEMLVGRRKFNEIFADVVRDPRSEVLRWMKWHGNRAVQAPPVHQVSPAVPATLGEIVARMIAKDPHQRFASMEELGRAIKQSFSPRAGARQGAAGGSAAGLTVTEPALAGAPAAGDIAAPAPLGRPRQPAPQAAPQHDGVPGREGPATAPIPKKKITRKTKLVVLAGVVAAALIGTIALLVIQGSQQRAAVRNRLRAYDKLLADFQNAVEKNEKGLFEEAEKGFADIRKQYADSREADKATVMIPLCKAYIAVIDKQWDLADNAKRDAQQAIEDVQAKWNDRPGWASDQLKSWFKKKNEQVESFFYHATDSQAFIGRKRMADALLAGVAALDEGMAAEEPGTATYLARARTARQDLEAARRGNDSDDTSRYLDDGAAAMTEAEGALGLLPPDTADRQEVRNILFGAKQKLVPLARSMHESFEGDFTQKTPQQRAELAAYRRSIEDEETEIGEELARLKRETDQQKRRQWEAAVVQLRKKAEGQLDQARALAQQGKIDEARGAIKLAQRERNTLIDYELPAELQRERTELKEFRDKAREDVESAIATTERAVNVAEANWAKEKDYQRALEAARIARAKGDKPAELSSLQRAVSLKPPALKDWASRLKTLELGIQLDQAIRDNAEGRISRAITTLDRILREDPENKLAQQILKDARSKVDWAKLLAQGDGAMGGRRWQEAIDAYEQAKRIRFDQMLVDKVAQCKYELGLEKGDRLFAEGKLEEAVREYERLYQVMPKAKLIIEARQRRVERRIRYDTLYDSGQAMLQKGKWLEARKNFTEAAALYPNDHPDLRDKAEHGKAKAMYGHWLTMGQSAMADGNYKVALASFINAKKNAQTAEEIHKIDELIAAAERAVAAAEAAAED